MKRAFGAAVLGLLAGLLWATPASAHAALLGSSPENGEVVPTAPSQVTLRFSEPVEPVPGQVRIVAPDGGRADRGEPRAAGTQLRIGLRDGAGRGTYLVSFRVISADGHPVAGGFTFSIGEPSESPPSQPGAVADNPLVSRSLSIFRYVGYAGLVLLVGAVGALAYAWPATLSRRRPGRLAWAGLVAVAVSALGELWLQAPYLLGTGLTGVTAGDLLDVLDSRYGYAHLARLACLAAAVPLTRRLTAEPRQDRQADGTHRSGAGSQRRRGLHSLAGPWRWVPAALGVVLVATWPLSGHPAASPVPWLSVALDMAHLGAVSLWLGGLVVLVGCLLPGRGGQAHDALGALLPGWSRWAFGAVTVLVVAGVSQAAIEVGGFGQLVDTRYGLLLLAKAGILTVLLVAAWFARRLTRREGSAPGLRRVVTVELVLAAVVLAVTSVLVQTTPARTEAAVRAAAPPVSGYTTNLDSSLYRLRVEVEPARVGSNTLHLSATSRAGRPLTVEEWRVTAALPERGIAPIDVPLLELTGDHAVGEITLPSPGRWVFRFTLRTSEIDQATVRAVVPVK